MQKNAVGSFQKKKKDRFAGFHLTWSFVQSFTTMQMKEHLYIKL